VSNIDFEYLLSVTDDDCQHAGYIASLIHSGKYTQEQAIRIYRGLGEAIETSYHEAFNDGNGEAVLAAINYCMVFDYPMPRWLTEAWRSAHSQWTLGDAKTIDAALRIRRGHLKTIGRQSLAPLIQRYVRDYRNERGKENAPIDEYMFERAAEYISELFPDLSMKASTARDLYYSASNPWK
jgi:hypothetical protein